MGENTTGGWLRIAAFGVWIYFDGIWRESSSPVTARLIWFVLIYRRGKWNNFTGTVSSSFVGHISPYTKEPCEVWTAIWLDGNCALSGAEDNLLKLWDFRANDKQPVSVNRVHQCGIVSLNSEEDSEHLIISGSYDEYLRRIDLRNFNEPLLERKVQI